MWRDQNSWRPFFGILRCVIAAAAITLAPCCASGQDQLPADEQLRASVKRSLERGCNYLKAQQADDGSWSIAGGQYTIGVTSLAVMALINSDVPVNSPEVQAGLSVLRSIGPEGVGGPAQIYETSLAVMALCAAEQFDRDLPRIQRFARLIEESQVVEGNGTGYWSYSLQMTVYEAAEMRATASTQFWHFATQLTQAFECLETPGEDHMTFGRRIRTLMAHSYTRPAAASAEA